MQTPATLTHPSQAFDSLRRFAWGAWAERLFLLLLILLFTVKGFIPAWRHLNSDFPNYYVAARLYRAGYPMERVYEWEWFQRQKDYVGIDQGLVAFINLTLPSVLPLAPWSSLPPLEAKHRWLVANLVFLLLTAFLLTHITTLSWERVALFVFLAFIPLRNSFLFGQMHVLVLLLLTFAAWLYFRKSLYSAGVILAIAAALKVYPALFLIFFICRKQWRAAAGLVVGLLGAAGVSLYMFGRDACLLYVREVLPASLRGEMIDPYSVAWNSLTALLRRLFIGEPELNPTPVAHLPWLYALLQPLAHGLIFFVFIWAIGSQKRDGSSTKLEWATYLFLLLFLSPQPATYHFVALILTTVLVVDYLLAQQRIILAGFAVAIYALICGPTIQFPWASPTGWQNLLFFPRLALMAAFGGVLLWILVPLSGTSFRERFNSKTMVVAACTLVLLITVGVISTERHLRGQFENYGSRIATTTGDLFASNPVFSSGSVLFTAMVREGYTIRRLRSGSILDVPRIGCDWFHPTVSETGSTWAEQASDQGSRVVRVLANPGQTIPATTPEAQDAQEPVLSRDGHAVAFLRAVNGRNALWVREIGARVGGSDPVAAHEIAGAAYNVREASFLPDHRLIFSSKRNGRFALYVATQAGNIEELKRPTCPARYPAISPDGRWIAFTCEQQGSSQIHLTDLEGNQELQLSHGDCNSISPAWTDDSKRLIYATDCGRGLGLTALAEVTVFP
jgi:hypothetical protein